MKVTRNFDFDKLIRSDAASRWLNEFGRRINQSIQDGLDNSTDITAEVLNLVVNLLIKVYMMCINIKDL